MFKKLVLVLLLTLPSYCGLVYDHLFSEFYQTEEGNCASIAVIKAAMDQYGENVLDYTYASNGTISFKQLDDFSGNLTQNELALSEDTAKIGVTSQREGVVANILFATMAKRVQMSQLNGCRTYFEGVSTLCQASNPIVCGVLLGLVGKIELVDPNALGSSNGIVLWSDIHAIYVDRINKHFYYDNYGLARRFSGEDGTRYHRKVLGGFKLLPLI